MIKIVTRSVETKNITVLSSGHNPAAKAVVFNSTGRELRVIERRLSNGETIFEIFDPTVAPKR